MIATELPTTEESFNGVFISVIATLVSRIFLFTGTFNYTFEPFNGKHFVLARIAYESF